MACMPSPAVRRRRESERPNSSTCRPSKTGNRCARRMTVTASWVVGRQDTAMASNQSSAKAVSAVPPGLLCTCDLAALNHSTSLQVDRLEEHTSELQVQIAHSYAGL